MFNTSHGKVQSVTATFLQTVVTQQYVAHLFVAPFGKFSL